MKRRPLGKTGMDVSILSYGASALGSVYREINDEEGIRAVHMAFDRGVNYFDVAPAYGNLKAEVVLGKALAGLPRDQYLLSTKTGKWCSYDGVGDHIYDFSEDRIRASLQESMDRLGTDYLDIVHLHDIEYDRGCYIDQALGEGLTVLQELKKEGVIRAVGVSNYDMAVWHQVLARAELDTIMVHNHYCLNDTLLLELFPEVRKQGIGIINASPFASGLLTQRGPADWHPIGEKEKAIFRKAVKFCADAGSSIEEVAMPFALGNDEIPTTLVSTASADRMAQNLDWSELPLNPALVEDVQQILAPVMNRDWAFAKHCT
ncbi:aldo/keto reductase [Pontiella agarivorans]|uniref:Aldo/keto reductase n=1 Tax=Pontiella agarivorans TaxID=3038953 RepID=A0ABU5MS25_9BACT|nr:aldo/keto reductase [Pontiella agarivorans]MDZ8117012.1 aldo/keto reductase [Pontiella agarivorans]